MKILETLKTSQHNNTKLPQGPSWSPKNNNSQFKDWQLWDSVNSKQPKPTWLVIRTNNWQQTCCLIDWRTVILKWKSRDKVEAATKVAKVGKEDKADKVDRADKEIMKMMMIISSTERKIMNCITLFHQNIILFTFAPLV